MTKHIPAPIHTVRCKNGMAKQFRLTRQLAISLMCSECLGFEGDPQVCCTSPMCPLFPYRRRTIRSHRGNIPLNSTKGH
jgi:hypothetical protein